MDALGPTAPEPDEPRDSAAKPSGPDDTAGPPSRPEEEEQEDKAGSGRHAARRDRRKDRLKELAKLLFEVFVLALVIYVFVFQISIVKGQSMMPSFAEGDRLVIDKVTYRFAEVGRFDVIVFRVPKAKHKDYIKRVIGLPGEEVELRGGALYIDGKFVLQDFSFRNQVEDSFGPKKVRPGHYFVLGDNRSASTDSRKATLVGQVPVENIRGRVRLRVWPLGKMKAF